MEMSTDTDNDHVSSYGQDVWRVLNLRAYTYCYSGVALCLISLMMEEEQEMVGIQFNRFEELELTF